MARVAIPIGDGTATVTVGGITYAPQGAGGDFYPADVALTVRARELTVIDLGTLGTADSIAVTAPSAGWIADRGDDRFSLDLTEVHETADVTFNYTATKSGQTISGVCRVAVLPPHLAQGPARALHYTFPTNAGGSYVFEPGRNHRAVYVSTTGISLAAIQGVGGSGSGIYMRDTIVPGSLGGNGVLRFGEAPSVALDASRASVLWATLQPAVIDGNSNWMLFKRGEDFSTFALTQAANHGESALHPIVFGAYGEGADPIYGRMVMNLGCQYLAVQNLALSRNLEHTNMANFVVDGLVAGEGASEFAPISGHLGHSFTIRNMVSLDSIKPPVAGAVYHSEKGQRASNVFASGGEMMLIEGVFFDIAGWEEGYPTLPFAQSNLYPVTDEQPPSVYSHNCYNGNVDRANGAPGARWLRYRNCIFSRPALTGVQLRPGGSIMDCIFIGCNLGALFGGGDRLNLGADLKAGTSAFAYRNLVTWAGQKTGYTDAELAVGFNTNAPETVLLDNIVVNKGPVNDGTYAWTSTGVGDPAIKFQYNNVNPSKSTQAGSYRFDNTIVSGWVSEDDNQNLSGVDLTTLNARSMAAWADAKLSTTGSENRDASEYLRTLDKPWELVPDIFNYFGTPANRTMDARTTSINAVFLSDDRGITPGFYWDLPVEWVGGEVPGTVAGDTADINGHIVECCDSPTLASLHLRGGVYRANGGRMTTGTIASGGRIELAGAGQVFTDGITASDLLTVDMHDGRFLNSGTISNNLDVFARNNAEVILGYDSAACTIATGRMLQINGSGCRVGFDGAAGGAAVLTVNGTVQARSMLRIFFKSNFVDANGSRAQWILGRAVTGATSGATGIVRRFGYTTIQVAGVAGGASGENQLSVGFVEIDGWTGDFLADEPLMHLGMSDYLPHTTPRQMGLMHRFEIRNPLPLDSTGRGMIEEFRSGINGTTAPNVASTLALGAASAFTADLRGLVSGSAYCVARADTITGTFASEVYTGGAGTISYATPGKVILTVA